MSRLEPPQLRRPAAPSPPPDPSDRRPGAGPPRWAEDDEDGRGDEVPWSHILQWLALGAVAGIVATALLPCRFTWLLCALPHEMGHATVGCLLGLPSTPAVSLAGHAWTGHGEFRLWLALLWPPLFAGFAWAFRERRALAVTLASLAVVLPLFAFTRFGSVLTIAGGHLGELAFAGYCFHHVVVGGKTGSAQERSAFAMLGGILLAANVRLTFGLMTDAAARALYGTNGSLGLKNDYLRLAEDVLGCRLETVAFAMLAVALLPLPLGILIGRWRGARTLDS